MNKNTGNSTIIKGRWFNINKKITSRLNAKYDKIKDWKMDPKGYFLIDVARKENIIRVGYCKFTKLGNDPSNDMVAEVRGKTAIEIVNTLIREQFISSLQHAADMGIELHKAELALKNNLKYIQDKDLIIDN
jgi:dihydropteroate synthase